MEKRITTKSWRRRFNRSMSSEQVIFINKKIRKYFKKDKEKSEQFISELLKQQIYEILMIVDKTQKSGMYRNNNDNHLFCNVGWKAACGAIRKKIENKNK